MKTTAKRNVDRQAAAYRPTRGEIDKPRDTPESILRAVEKGGEIRLDTLAELLRLLATKTDYHFHIASRWCRPAVRSSRRSTTSVMPRRRFDA